MTASTSTVTLPIHVYWAHAVNSQALLAAALDKSQAIEADVLLNSGNEPVMAHPPATDSNLTLRAFLAQVESGTGIVKLDFKSDAAFGRALPLLREVSLSLKARLWINADIVQGSNAAEPQFVAAEFVANSIRLGAGKLSLGWTTSSNSTEYTPEMVRAMLQLLSDYDSSVAVTFPVKASLVRGSWDALKALYQNPKHGMTLWLNEAMDDADLVWLYQTLETPALQGRTYYDLHGWNALVQRKGW
ncbi:hypothetical protein H310_09252 [Aphanomyces invadans]|uniref:Menorin-like domain-containing protein n=1 Tax=Aphanomyces invadans TaxID=157072 RepID=A0A024TX92_9STRA|nr:hypothetical protein H310_09252 [Aphanomyces invadans]ETV97937.1 hypothetical protein H310_09252 [Aphanomyces invadans]|eukprot:XP_008873498.1 hypothetical protein H310_09252 [Aphanomyces invadans]